MASELVSPLARQLDANGDPYSGAQFKFYESGTTTPQAVYADADLSTSLGAVVTADAGGKFVPIWMDSSKSYRGIVENATGSVTLHDIDPINFTGFVDYLGNLIAVTKGPATGDAGNERTNIAIGGNTLTDNTFVDDGYAAGGGIFYNQGDWNIAIGENVLGNNTTGHRNIGIGRDALAANTTGRYNIALGVWAGKDLTTGIENVYIGTQSGQFSTTGSFNVGVGSGTLLFQTTGYENTALGDHALANISTGFYNVAVGRQAGLALTTGDSNAILGFQAGSGLTTGTYNTVMGQGAMGFATTATENTAIGRRSLSTATGSYNTGLGADSGVSITTGQQNTMLGDNAGSNVTTGSNNIMIGYAAQASSASVSNEVTLGNASVNTLRLGGGNFAVSDTDFKLSHTTTAGGTTGAQSIAKPAGRVNFAAAATTLVVTNALVTANSIIIATVNTNDGTMKYVTAEPTAGSFTLRAQPAAPTGETKVSYVVYN